MILPDINVLIYAHRFESPFHQRAYDRLQELGTSLTPFAINSFVLSGFLRIVTNHKVFKEPTPLVKAIEFVEALLNSPQVRIVEPGNQHWLIMKSLLKESHATANLISDVYLAAIAVENGCTLLTNDRDFNRFASLKKEIL